MVLMLLYHILQYVTINDMGYSGIKTEVVLD